LSARRETGDAELLKFGVANLRCSAAVIAQQENPYGRGEILTVRKIRLHPGRLDGGVPKIKTRDFWAITGGSQNLKAILFAHSQLGWSLGRPHSMRRSPDSQRG